MKRLFLFLLLPAIALAQTAATRTSLNSEVDVKLPSGTAALTAANLRLTLKDIIASTYNPLTDGPLYAAGAIPLTALNTTGTPSATTYLRGDGVWATPAGSGGGTVNSVSFSAPSFLSVSGSPVTNSGTIALSYSGTPLPVVNGGTGTATPSLVAGTNVTVTGSWPNQTINSTGSGGGVSSVGITAPSFLSVSGSPITGAGTLALTYSGTPIPVANGGTGTTTPAIVAGTNITVTGTWPNQTINSTASGSGTVTSVGLTTPSWLTVSGSPVTGAGTLGLTATGSQTANLVLATPDATTGAVGLRALTANDIPVHDTSKLTSGVLAVARGGSGTATPGLVAGANVTVTGSWPNQTVAASASSGMTNPFTTTGDMLYASSGTTPGRIAIGSTGQILTVSGGAPVWAAAPTGTIPSMTGNTGKYLTTTDGVNASWGTITASVGQTLEYPTTFSSAGQTDIVRSIGSQFHTSFLTAGAGSGAYTRIVDILKGNTPQAGNTVRTIISLPASTNPTIQIRDGSPSGTILATITNPSATAAQIDVAFIYDGTNWNLTSSTFVPSTGGGGGDMLIATWDTDTNGAIDLAKGGTNATTAAGARTNLGLATVAASGLFADLTSKPTTLAGYGITDSQALDGDLTSLAAASGTNTMYYRSAANTWSAVTVGANLTFTGGTLAASASSGLTDPSTTKGDILARNASAVTRVAVGTDGQVLTADSAQATGVKWATPITGSSPVTYLSNVTYYVSTTGNDSNDGLSSGAPKTLQGMLDFFEGATIKSSATVTIQLADGTYSTANGYFCRSFFGGGLVYLQGNTTTPSAVSLNCTDTNARSSLNVNPVQPCSYKAGYMTVPSVSQYTSCILVSNSGTFYIGTNLRFVAFTPTLSNGHIFVEMPTAKLFLDCTAYIIAGGANSHIFLKGGAYADLYNSGNSYTITGSSSYGFPNGFIRSQLGASAIIPNITLTGVTITGPRYNVDGVAVINDIGTIQIPGNSAGTATNGGVYIGP